MANLGLILGSLGMGVAQGYAGQLAEQRKRQADAQMKAFQTFHESAFASGYDWSKDPGATKWVDSIAGKGYSNMVGPLVAAIAAGQPGLTTTPTGEFALRLPGMGGQQQLTVRATCHKSHSGRCRNLALTVLPSVTDLTLTLSQPVQRKAILYRGVIRLLWKAYKRKALTRALDRPLRKRHKVGVCCCRLYRAAMVSSNRCSNHNDKRRLCRSVNSGHNSVVVTDLTLSCRGSAS